MEFKVFIKENEKDFSDYVELKKQIKNLEDELPKIKAGIMTSMQIKEDEKDIERIDQEIDEIEKEIREVKSSFKKGSIWHRLLHKDQYEDELDKLYALEDKIERLNEEKNRIIEICNAREEAKKQLPKIESKIESLKSEVEDRKKKLIELIEEQSRVNSNSAVHKESEKQKIMSRILILRERNIKVEGLLGNSDSKLPKQTQRELDKRTSEIQRFKEELEFLKAQKTLYNNLKDHIDDSEMIKKLLEKIKELDKIDESKDEKMTICGKDYKVNTDGFIEMQGKNNDDIGKELNDTKKIPEYIKLNDEEKKFVRRYTQGNGTLVIDIEQLQSKFNVRRTTENGNTVVKEEEDR